MNKIEEIKEMLKQFDHWQKTPKSPSPYRVHVIGQLIFRICNFMDNHDIPLDVGIALVVTAIALMHLDGALSFIPSGINETIDTNSTIIRGLNSVIAEAITVSGSPIPIYRKNESWREEQFTSRIRKFTLILQK